MERIEIRVLHDEAQSHRLAGQAAHVAAVVPAHHTLDFVTDDFRTSFEREAGNGPAGRLRIGQFVRRIVRYFIPNTSFRWIL